MDAAALYRGERIRSRSTCAAGIYSNHATRSECMNHGR